MGRDIPTVSATIFRAYFDREAGPQPNLHKQVKVGTRRTLEWQKKKKVSRKE